MFKTALRRGVTLTAAAATVLTLAGCSGSSDSEAVPEGTTIEVPGATAEVTDFLNELYQSAVQSGKTDVVMYGPAGSTSAPMYAKFSKRFPGLKIVPQDAADAQTLTKLQVEADSGKRIADLYAGGGPSTAQAAAEPNICTKADIKTAPPGFEVPYQADGKVLPFEVKYFTFVYNTKMVSEDEVPRTWADLLDSKWKGKIEMADPTVAGGVRYVLTSLLVPESADTWGEDYLTKLASQDIQIGQSEPTIPADVASGRFPLGIGVYSGYYKAQKAKGAPIGIVFPLEDGGNFMNKPSICLIQDAPHADAALLYLNWLFTEEGQKVLAEEDDAYGLLPGAPGPMGAPPLDQLKTLPPSNPDPKFNEPYFAIIDRLFK